MTPITYEEWLSAPIEERRELFLGWVAELHLYWSGEVRAHTPDQRERRRVLKQNVQSVLEWEQPTE